MAPCIPDDILEGKYGSMIDSMPDCMLGSALDDRVTDVGVDMPVPMSMRGPECQRDSDDQRQLAL